MKIKALKLFNDGWEKRLRRPGDVFETTQERFEYWSSASLVSPVEGEEDERGDLDSMTKAELLKYGQSHGVEDIRERMRKAEIIAAIKGAMGQ